jgi:hypothetical protein
MSNAHRLRHHHATVLASPPSRSAGRRPRLARRVRIAAISLGLTAVIALTGGTSASLALTGVSQYDGSRAAGARAIPKKWIGTWRLVSEKLVDQNGTRVGSLFTDTAGKLTYTPRGDVWALVGPRVPSESEKAIWYTGTAEVRRKAGVVVHHVQYASIASWIDTDLRRRYEFFAHGKGLTLSAKVTPELTDVLKWRKAGARWAGPL